MPRMTKAQAAAKAARDTRVNAVVAEIAVRMGAAYAYALGKYAAAKGENWAEELTLDWYRGRDANFRDSDGKLLGPELRMIRNSPVFGPAFYKALNGE